MLRLCGPLKSAECASRPGARREARPRPDGRPRPDSSAHCPPGPTSLSYHPLAFPAEATGPHGLASVSLQYSDARLAHGAVLPIAVTKDPLVGLRNCRQGTWQWTILVMRSERGALGVHTRTEGQLAPVYRALIDALRARQFICESFKKDKDALIRFLQILSGFHIPEFDEKEGPRPDCTSAIPRSKPQTA